MPPARSRSDGQGKVIAWVCDPGDIGGISDYDQFGPPTWRQSGRYTSINGEVIPTFAGAQVGRIERWRIVHAGVRDTVNLQFKKMRREPSPTHSSRAPQQQDWVTRNCPGRHAAAAVRDCDRWHDPRAADRAATTTLQPGYREDMLVVFPERRRLLRPGRRGAGGQHGQQSGQEPKVSSAGLLSPPDRRRPASELRPVGTDRRRRPADAGRRAPGGSRRSCERPAAELVRAARGHRRQRGQAAAAGSQVPDRPEIPGQRQPLQPEPHRSHAAARRRGGVEDDHRQRVRASVPHPRQPVPDRTGSSTTRPARTSA